MNFVMYCAGVSLLVLVVYIVVRGQGFSFDVGKEGVKLATVKSALSPKAVEVDKDTEQRSKDLGEKFEAAMRPVAPEPTEVKKPAKAKAKRAGSATEEDVADPPPPGASAIPFNGTWTGNGSTYVLQQQGAHVAFQELTNGLVTSAGGGTATGNRAEVDAMNVAGLTIPIQLSIEGTKLVLSAFGATYVLERN
jgi:hypothetical protein